MAEKKWFRHVWPDVVPIQYKRIRVTSAEILLLYTTPKKLLDAPGSGKVIELLSMVSFLDHGGTSYTAGGNLTVQTITGNTTLSATIANSDLINASADAYNVTQALSADVVLNVNDGLELVNASAVHATGNGVLVVEIAYRIHDFS